QGSDAAMDADRHLAASAECGEGGAFRGDGIARGRMVEERDGSQGGGIGVAGLDAQRALSGGGAEMLGVEPFAQPFGFFKSIEACGGEQDGVDLALGEFAQAGIDVAAKLDSFDIGTEGEKLGAASLA